MTTPARKLRESVQTVALIADAVSKVAAETRKAVVTQQEQDVRQVSISGNDSGQEAS